MGLQTWGSSFEEGSELAEDALQFRSFGTR